jgi:hypothetical protein
MFCVDGQQAVEWQITALVKAPMKQNTMKILSLNIEATMDEDALKKPHQNN